MVAQRLWFEFTKIEVIYYKHIHKHLLPLRKSDSRVTMIQIDSVKTDFQALCAKFEKDKTHYLSKDYPESQVRIDFLNPFFGILGWDIENKSQQPPHARDVIVEVAHDAAGRPDYNFRIKGTTKFFVEAKTPAANLDDASHIMQAKSYAWSTKNVFFVILTNFKEFKLFDASLKPNPRLPDEGLIYHFQYTDYPNNVEKLWELSKERVEEGSLEVLLPRDLKSKRLRIPPDKAFLEDLTSWREDLAKDIHKRNPAFDVKLLNDVVQRLLDRIIFIRIGEDRDVVRNRGLWDIVALWKAEGKRKAIMTNLNELFRKLNDDLNGNIFRPHACETIEVDSTLLADIIEGLYAPKSQYRFDAIGVELLGSIYERYLGNTIRVTPQRVKVEEKPEVRKAGGVYYTPKYIVDYIVKNTVGKIVEGKSPKQIEKIRILDPACGSGSFLLGAYRYLIDYHLKYYREHPKQAHVLYYDPYYKINPDEITLPIQVKARILKNNIFGVDIDPQAAEITMLSLYLKAIEGERGLLPMRQHLLPSLSNNIICGNSLVGYDMFQRGQGTLFSDETQNRVNPFDWNSKSAGFGEIMENGGFDVVMGNPPYVRIQALDRAQVEYFARKYQSASGNYDIYALFVEKALQLLRKDGAHGFILPHKFFQAAYGQGLRRLIAESGSLTEVVNFRDNQVFDGASTYTCLLFLSRNKADKFKYVEVQEFLRPAEQLETVFQNSKLSDQSMRIGFVPKKQVTPSPWNFHFPDSNILLDKLKLNTRPLADLAERIFQGLKTSADKIYTMDVIEKRTGTIIAHSKELNKDIELESELLKPLIKGGQMRRYLIEEPKKVVLFPYINGKLITKTEFQKTYPLCWAYLMENKKYLENREDGKMKGENWYAYGRTQAIEVVSIPKIITPDLASSASYCFDEEGKYYFSGGAAGGYGIIVKDEENSKYLLALLNSRLLDWYHHQISTTFRGGYFSYESRFIKDSPIRVIDFSKHSEKVLYDHLIVLVDRMLELRHSESSLPTCAEREKIEREIAVTDEKIDEIVYGLYGISEQERKTIERGRDMGQIFTLYKAPKIKYD